MNNYSAADIVLMILYITGALTTLFVAYWIYIKKFKRNKLEAVNDVSLITSEKDNYMDPSQFLVVVPIQDSFKLSLLAEDETHIKVLAEVNENSGEFPVHFDPTDLAPGKYYLYLESTNSNILRKIKVKLPQGA